MLDGRVTHLADLMHRAEASNGSAISSNWILSTDGTKRVRWRPETTGGTPSLSYGSNANDVGDAGAAGASSLVTRADHVHRGVRSISANGSNSLFGNVNLKAGSGIALGVTAQDITITNISGGASGGGTSLTIEEADGSPTVAASKLVLPNGTLGVVGTVATYTPAASGGGDMKPFAIQTKQVAPNGSSLTLDATPIAGHRILLAINRLGTSTTTSVSSTNTTWTMLEQFVSAGSCIELWVGVCASSPGAVITYTAGTSNFNSVRALEIAFPALTPTVGVTLEATTAGGRLTGITAGSYVIGTTTNVDTGIVSASAPFPSRNISGMGSPGVGIGMPGETGVVVPLWIAYCPSTVLVAEGVVPSGNAVTMLAEVT